MQPTINHKHELMNVSDMNHGSSGFGNFYRDQCKKARCNEWQSNKLTIYETTKYLPSECS
jgi:hypothetical protein